MSMCDEINDSRYSDLGVNMPNAQRRETVECVLLPHGEYQLCIKDGSIEYSASGNKYVNLQYTVSAGEYQGRGVVFDHFFLWGEKSGIAKGKFASLRKAVGLDGSICGCIDDLIGREFIGKVMLKDSKRPNAEQGEKENSVSTYKKMNGATQGTSAPKPAPKPEPVAPIAAQPEQTVQPSEQTQPRVNPW